MKFTLEPGDVIRLPRDPKSKSRVSHGLVLSKSECIIFSTCTVDGENIVKTELPDKFSPMFQRDKDAIPLETLTVFKAIVLAMNLPTTGPLSTEPADA